MLGILTSKQFDKDLKLAKKRGFPMDLLQKVVVLLCEEKSLPLKHRDHALTGNWEGFRECHIQPDWLLIYRVNKVTNVLHLSRTGTHSDLF